MKNKKPQILGSGQSMLIVVLVLAGTMLGATTIAGFLTIIQLQQAGDVASSAKAIFAAEAGIECGLYMYNNPAAAPSCWTQDNGDGTVTLKLDNKTSATFSCYQDTDFGNDSVVPCEDEHTILILSKGVAGVVTRAFQYTITLTP